MKTRSSSGAPVTDVADAFQLAHDRLAASLEACLEASVQPASVARSLRRFLDEVRRHVRIEEELLFDRFEEQSGLKEQGPTVLLRREHREITRRLDRLASALERGETGDVRTGIRALLALLEDHRRREALALFPTCDRLLDGGERRRALAELRRTEPAPPGETTEPDTECTPDAPRPGKRGQR